MPSFTSTTDAPLGLTPRRSEAQGAQYQAADQDRDHTRRDRDHPREGALVDRPVMNRLRPLFERIRRGKQVSLLLERLERRSCPHGCVGLRIELTRELQLLGLDFDHSMMETHE